MYEFSSYNTVFIILVEHIKFMHNCEATHQNQAFVASFLFLQHQFEVT